MSELLHIENKSYIRNKMWYKRFFYSFIGAIIVTSCVCEPAALDPEPEDLFETFTTNIAVDNILNPKSEYVVVIGDIQEYISPGEQELDCYSYYLSTMGWIYAQQNAWGNIKCVLLTGDMTWGNLLPQWDRYKVGASFFEDTLPLLICTGNHDYDWSQGKDGRWVIEDRESSMINDFFPGQALDMLITERYDPITNENYVAKLEIGNDTIKFLILEFAPRKEVIKWAKDIVEKDLGSNYILMTHEMLFNDYMPHLDSYARYHFEGTKSTYTTPNEIWQELICPNDNIICSLCGHNQFFSHVKLTNAKGREVSNIMFNLQYEKNGGDGMVQLWEFPLDEDKINVFTYNTIDRTIVPKVEGFTIKY